MLTDLGEHRQELPLDWLVTPAAAFSHPDDVLGHPALTNSEKRAILASWASDAHAVEDLPWLRQLENGARVAVAEVLGAIRKLDAEKDQPLGQSATRDGVSCG
jgi:hypothetical protein